MPYHETIGPILEIRGLADLPTLDINKLAYRIFGDSRPIETEVLRTAVEALPHKERFVIGRRFGVPTLTLKATAKLVDVTPERIRQLEYKGIRLLRRDFSRTGLYHYTA